MIRPHIPDLLASYSTLGKFDFIRAKARFALDVDAHMPQLEQKPHIEWYHAQHPALFLSLREHGKEVVPLNIQLTKENRILIISGPNAGGVPENGGCGAVYDAVWRVAYALRKLAHGHVQERVCRYWRPAVD